MCEITYPRTVKRNQQVLVLFLCEEGELTAIEESRTGQVLQGKKKKIYQYLFTFLNTSAMVLFKPFVLSDKKVHRHYSR